MKEEGDGAKGEEGEEGEEQPPRPADILGQIFKGARQRRAENEGGSGTPGGWSGDEVDWAR